MAELKVGLALGAGSARGLANIGVVQVLEEHQIPIDVITGTSAGAVVAGLYASGTSMDMIGRMTNELDWNDLVNFTITRRGLVSSEPIYQMLRILTKGQAFEDLAIPAAVVAADITTGEEVVISSGGVAEGVRASLSIPGVFVPVELNGRLLVDGALVNRVPASVCRDLGADLVIAVDVGWPPLRKNVRNLPDVIMSTIDILNRQSAKFRPIEADILLEPELGNVGSTQLNRAEEIIEAGRRAASAHVEQIKRKIRSRIGS